MIRKCPKCNSLEICQQEEHPGGYILTFSCGLAIHLDRRGKPYQPPKDDPAGPGRPAASRQSDAEWYGLAAFQLTLYGFNPDKLRREGGIYFWQTEPPSEVILTVFHQPLTRKTEKRRIVAMEFLGARSMMTGDVKQVRLKGIESFLEEYPSSQRVCYCLEWEPNEYLKSLLEG